MRNLPSPLVLLLGLLSSACLPDEAAPPGGEACSADAVSVFGMIVNDRRVGAPIPHASVLLQRADNPEAPAPCDATVAIAVGSERSVLERTSYGYEAGVRDGMMLPPLALVPGAVHDIEIDLDSDGTVDVVGTVTLSEISSFRATSVTPSAVSFAWDDAGDAASTYYAVQLGEGGFGLGGGSFATGIVDRVTAIGFGGPGEPRYFTPNGQPISARIQASTDAVFPTPSSLTAWDYPPEPIMQY